MLRTNCLGHIFMIHSPVSMQLLWMEKGNPDIAEKIQIRICFVEKSRNKLDNPGFLSNAPKKVVKDLRKKVIDTEKTLKALKQQIRDLKKLAS